MKKGRRIGSEIPLPEAIIQKIQSFMSGKEAARTTILSKSWYNAWLTRPSIDLDDGDFWLTRPSIDADLEPQITFEEFTSTTMQRYRDLGLNIESFRLRMYQRYDFNKANMISDYLIADAMKIGATDVLVELPHSFSLPQEVLGSQTLVRLSLTNCRFNGEYVIRCSGLQELSLSRCAGLALPNLYKLRSLFLHYVDVDTLFSSDDDIASRFPCLKDLSIRSCPGSTRIKISSTSLQTISFKPDRTGSEFYQQKVNPAVLSFLGSQQDEQQLYMDKLNQAKTLSTGSLPKLLSAR